MLRYEHVFLRYDQDKGDIPNRMMTPNTERMVQQAADLSASLIHQGCISLPSGADTTGLMLSMMSRMYSPTTMNDTE
jgi:hypothetical protein